VAHWLLKEEPTHYAWEDLLRDGSTSWDGVHNATALRNLRAMRRGEQGIFYHTGNQRACVGILETLGPPRADPRDDRGSWMVDVRAVRPLRRPIPLSEIKADPSFAGFDLIRIGRLSVVRVSDPHWARLLELEGAGPPVTEASAGPGRRTAPRAPRTSARRRR